MLPLVDLPPAVLLVVDVAAFVAASYAAGWFWSRRPSSALAADPWLLHERRWERQGRAYERLRIRRWKDRVPEAGGMFGGMPKRAIPSGRAGLEVFAAECRRAELVHWSAAVIVPVAALWNPPSGWPVLVVVGVALHGVPITIQRYNRQRIARIRARRT